MVIFKNRKARLYFARKHLKKSLLKSALALVGYYEEILSSQTTILQSFSLVVYCGLLDLLEVKHLESTPVN